MAGGVMLKTKEHYDLMEQFERTFKGRRLDRESKDSWHRQVVYQDAQVNELYLAYRCGYAIGKAIHAAEAAPATPEIP